MANIIIYTKSTCPYCRKAKALLESKGQSFEEIDILEHPERREEMIDRANGYSTVPQIFINGQHVGGCDDLHKLEEDGALDALLGSNVDTVLGRIG